MPIFLWGAANESLEVLAEEARIGEVEGFRDLGDLQVAVAQLHLGGGDDRLVYPFLRRDAAGLPYRRAKVSLGDANLLGVEGELSLRLAMVVDELEETVEDVVG